MKIRVSSACPTGHHTVAFNTHEQDLADGPLFQVEDPDGKSSWVYLQIFPYELFFVLAAQAYADHHYADCVARLRTAVELFQVFALRFLLASMKVHDDEVDNLLGTFRGSAPELALSVAFLSHFGERPPALVGTAIRNRLIHQGVIPRRADAKTYGDNCTTYILSVLGKLRAQPNATDIISRLDLWQYQSHLKKKRKRLGARCTNCVFFSPVSPLSTNPPLVSFEEAVNQAGAASDVWFGRETRLTAHSRGA